MTDNVRQPSMAKVHEFVFDQLSIARINTAEPGIVAKYDPVTKRARVRLAVRRGFRDGRNPIERAPLVNVPVIQPSTGGYMLHQQLDVDDIVLVIFSKEGLDKFKEEWGLSDPDTGQHFVDAVAIPWGRHDIEPVSNEGIVLQSRDGKTWFQIKDGEIRGKAGRGNFRLVDGEWNTWRD